MRRFLWFAVGLLMLGGGVALVLTTGSTTPESYGWFAYTPLSDDPPDWHMGWSDADRPYVVSLGQIVGVGVGALGIVVLVSGAAYLLGRRRARPGRTPRTDVT